MPIVKLTAEITNEEGLTTIAQTHQRIDLIDSDLGRSIRDLLQSIDKLSCSEWDDTDTLMHALYTHLEYQPDAAKTHYKPVMDVIRQFLVVR